MIAMSIGILDGFECGQVAMVGVSIQQSTEVALDNFSRFELSNCGVYLVNLS